jgi:ornithine cyclodeaminase/alanine dehydrogenase-like protein (mu-crystallin family)
MNAPPSALFLDAASLRGLVTYEELIEPVAVAFGELSRRLAESGVLSMYPAQSVELGDVLVKTGSIKGHSVYVVKISPWFAANEERRQHQGGFIAVFDAETGHTVAILEDEHYLSDIRTAAAGAVAAQQLAPDEVVTAAVLGAGTQAFWQPQALHRVRPYSTLKIWSRDTARSAQLRLKLERVLPDVEIHIGATAESVVRAADVIMTATSAREPIVHGSWLMAPSGTTHHRTGRRRQH